MLEWLVKLLPKDISINISPSITINKIKINSDNSSSEVVIIKKDELIVNDAIKEGKQLAEKLIKQLPSHMQHNDILLEDSNLESYQAIDKQLSSKAYRSQINEFKSIIPKTDIPILEVAIVVKMRYEAGENISVIKGQAVQRFGPRAGMICNLYSSDYYRTLIQPLYESVKEGKMAIDEYLETYEMIVTESPLAMFVGVGTPREKIKLQLLKKIESNKIAEVDYLNIHGIGDHNIKFIIYLLEDNDIKALFVDDPTIQLKGNSIKATVYI